MQNFRKVLTTKPLITIIIIIFLLDIPAYPINQSPRTHLRNPLLFSKNSMGLKVFTGELTRFTRMNPKEFVASYSTWLINHLQRPLKPDEKTEIEKFASIVGGESKKAWRHPEDAAESAETISELREGLKDLSSFPGVCDLCAGGVARIINTSELQWKWVERYNEATKEFNHYVEVLVAGEWIIVDPAADLWEFEAQERKPDRIYGYKDIVGLVIMPKVIVESNKYKYQVPMYTTWPITKTAKTLEELRHPTAITSSFQPNRDSESSL